MATERTLQAALALHRFGLGPRPGAIDAIADDPRGALAWELDRPGGGRVAASGLMTSGQANRAVFEFNQERQAQQRVARTRREAEQKRAAEMGMAAPAPSMAEPAAEAPAQPPLPQRIFRAEAKARFDAAAQAEIGFVERLVWFWSNHFCVNADATVMAGAYERESIRPHVLGRFVDMLTACEGHPAMLLYLDNAQSIGPNSVAGINATRGLNENLAREILELHTLGVRSVYSQDDVLSFAKVLTGWTVLPTATNPERGGEFVFNPRMHEPGPQTVIGKSYADTRVQQGRAVLADLARHPATAHHIAMKLARHFVSDTPQPSLVGRLEQTFLDTDGNLKELAKALIAAPEAWEPARTKIKRPLEWLMAAMRASGRVPIPFRMIQTLNTLGEPLWRPPAPRGFSDDSAVWADGLAQRLEVANQFAQRNAEGLDADALADVALGPLASEYARGAIARAESRPQALALLLMSPEFLRR